MADGVATAGLYDAAEERVVRRTLADLGLDGTDPGAHHLYRCERDLERACSPRVAGRGPRVAGSRAS